MKAVFLLMAGANYYPCSHAQNLVGCYETIDLATSSFEAMTWKEDWAVVLKVDESGAEIVWQNDDDWWIEAHGKSDLDVTHWELHNTHERQGAGGDVS